MKLCLNCHKQFTDEVELCPHEGSFLVPVPNDPLLGALIDERYRVESLIAKGAVGSVYKAKQELLGRQVALKVLHGYLGADPESLVRFHREAKAISRLEHPNLLTLYDFGMTADGQPYFVMDLLNGTTLAKLLTCEGRLDVRRTLTIVKQVLEALSEAHKKGIIHRDIKPPNIVLIDKEETKEFVKLVDFSIAKMADNSTIDPVQLTVDGIICGSPAYMSPEQCRGADVDGRSDIYSIGIVLFESLTGKRPFSAKDLVSLMYLHVNDEPPKLSDVEPDLQFPAELENLVSSTLAKDPAQRPQNVEALLARLNAVLEGCGDTLSSKPPLSTFNASVSQEDISPLFTKETKKNHGASSDSQDVFIGVTTKPAEGKTSEKATLQALEKTLQEIADFDATPSTSSSDSVGRLNPPAKQHNAAAISQSYDHSTEELLAPRAIEAPAPHTIPIRSEEQIAPNREMRNTGSFAQDSSGLYRNESEWTPSPLKMILPLIVIIVVGGIGVLKIWDIATPDTPAEMLVRGQTEKAISILENRQHSKRLTEDETSTLHTAYLNLARKYANQNKLQQAISTLKKVPAGSPLQDTAGRLLQVYKRQLFMSRGR
jgi:serine/threonine protein kinase